MPFVHHELDSLAHASCRHEPASLGDGSSQVEQRGLHARIALEDRQGIRTRTATQVEQRPRIREVESIGDFGSARPRIGIHRRGHSPGRFRVATHVFEERARFLANANGGAEPEQGCGQSVQERDPFAEIRRRVITPQAVEQRLLRLVSRWRPRKDLQRHGSVQSRPQRLRVSADQPVYLGQLFRTARQSLEHAALEQCEEDHRVKEALRHLQSGDLLLDVPERNGAQRRVCHWVLPMPFPSGADSRSCRSRSSAARRARRSRRGSCRAAGARCRSASSR